MRVEIRQAGLAASLLAMATASAAWAQESEAPADRAAEAESNTAIVVTGSRIKGVAPVGSSITSYSAADLQKLPASNVVDALNRDPQFATIGNNEAVKRSVGPGMSGVNTSRASDINLRGIAPKATLVLFDGMRVPGTGNNSRGRDSSLFPTMVIDRADIVADGASAIYGADAIAGVVNLIPRRSYDGFTARARYAFADSYDSIQTGFVAGREWDGGGFIASFEYRSNSRLSGLDRDYYRSDLRAVGGNDYRSTQCNPGTIVVGGVTYAIPEGGVTPATANLLVPGTANRCELSRRADLLPENQVVMAYGAITQQFGDLEVYARANYARRDYALTETVVGSRALGFDITVPRTNAFFVAPPDTNAASVTVRTLFDQRGLLPTRGFLEWQQYAVGGELAVGAWNVTADASYGKTAAVARTIGVLSPALTQRLASGDSTFAYNPFGGSNSTAVLDGVFLDNYDPSGDHVINEYSLQATGPLFRLPGGDVKTAVGVAYLRYDSYLYNRLGDLRLYRKTVTNEKRDIFSQYAELYVPVFGADNATTLFESLDLSAAVRRDAYSDFDATVNPKFGVNWSPVRGLLLRGSYGTSFNAPGLSQTVSPSTGASLIYTSLNDPQSPTNSSSGVIWNDGNPGLKPENATTWSVGAEVKPAALPGLSLSVTYFNIDYRDQVGTVNRSLSDPAAAAYVIRNPTQAQIDTLLATGLPTTGVRPPTLAWIIDGRSLNLGGLRLEGFDIRANYGWQWGDVRMRGGIDATVNTHFSSANTPGAPYLDYLNTIYNPQRFRARGYAGITIGGARGDLFVNHVNGYTNNLTTPSSPVEAYTTVDFSVGYDLAMLERTLSVPLAISLDINNLFDRDPPYANIDGGADLAVGSPLGRTIALTVSTKF